MKMRITRRAALRGSGGAAITLPALEAMFDRHGEAYAQGMPIPKRYLVCFGGQSLGGDGDPLHNDYVPKTIGPNYDLKSALAPLACTARRASRSRARRCSRFAPAAAPR